MVTRILEKISFRRKDAYLRPAQWDKPNSGSYRVRPKNTTTFTWRPPLVSARSTAFAQRRSIRFVSPPASASTTERPFGRATTLTTGTVSYSATNNTTTIAVCR